MTIDIALLEKREELKYRLAAGEYKTLVDIALGATAHIMQRITHRSKLLPIWALVTILMLVYELIIFTLIYPTGGLAVFRNLTDRLGVDYELGTLMMLSPSMLGFITIILMNQYIGRIFILWRDDVIDATESLMSVNQFEDWLKKICNPKLHIIVTLAAGLLIGLSNINLLSTIVNKFVGYGVITAIIFISVVSSTILYLFAMVILLSASLHKYELKLFAADPASSELLSHLSGLLTIFGYFVLAYTIYFTIGTTYIGLFSYAGIVIILLFWIPIIAMFILNQTGLSSIIRRAKWKTLNEIQAKVENLQSGGNYADKETMETINRLMDYHDRIKKTRNWAIDINTSLHFINSLLLPILAFVIANINTVISLLRKQP